MPPLLAALPNRVLRLLEHSAVPGLQLLLCDYTADVSLLTIHEAVQAPGDIPNQAPVHLCNLWRWLALEGELCAAGDLHVSLFMTGVLLTITAHYLFSVPISKIKDWDPNSTICWRHGPFVVDGSRFRSARMLCYTGTGDPCWAHFSNISSQNERR